MSNSNAPNGFVYYGRQDGGSPMEGFSTRLIASSDTAAVGYGDPVTSQTNGYVSASVNNTTQIDGVFYGCQYLSTALGRVINTNYYPGSGAGGDVTAYICDDPDAQFVVQSDNTAIAFADTQSNIGFVAGTPNATTGFSTAAVGQSTLSTTNTLPFRVIGLLSASAPPGTAGTDNTSAYNRVIVGFNNTDRKALLGIA